MGQQLYQTVIRLMMVTAETRVKRMTELLKMADAGEPSSLADVPVLCKAVRGDEGKEMLQTGRSCHNH